MRTAAQLGWRNPSQIVARMRPNPNFLSCGTFDLAKFQDEEREDDEKSGASVELPFKEGGGLIHDMTSGLTDIITSFQSRVLERGYDGGSLRSGLRSGLLRSFMENRRGATERRRVDLGRRQSCQSVLPTWRRTEFIPVISY